MAFHFRRNHLLVGSRQRVLLYELKAHGELLELGEWGGYLRVGDFLTIAPDGNSMLLSTDYKGVWQQTLFPKLGRLENQTYTLNKPIPPLMLPIFEGGVPPITYTLTPDSMPPGLFYDRSNKQIIGVPTRTGIWNYTYTAEDSGGLSDSVDFGLGTNRIGFSINVVLPTSTSSEPELPKLEVYPVPAITEITFTQDGHVTVFDMLGRKVMDAQVNDYSPLRVDQLPTGLYLYSFMSRHRRVAQPGKFIKL